MNKHTGMYRTNIKFSYLTECLVGLSVVSAINESPDTTTLCTVTNVHLIATKNSPLLNYWKTIKILK